MPVQATAIIAFQSSGTDALHHGRVSLPVRQFTSTSEYIDSQLHWEKSVAGTGTVAVQANISSVRLSTGGTVNAASAIRQTKRYMRSQPAKSLMILQTFVMSAAQTNTLCEIGYNDGYNGVFLQRNASTFNVVQRSFTSGSAVDTTIAQASWNLDKLDGTGSSGVTLDLTKTQILAIDMGCLDVGQVRIGFDFGGNTGLIYCHQFLNANSIATAYASTASLPVRGRVFNSGTAGGTVTLDMICTAVINEGSGASPNSTDTDQIYNFSAGTGPSLIAVTGTLLPVFSLRAATKLGGAGVGTITNRGQIIPNNFGLYADSAPVYYEVWLGPGTGLGGGTSFVAQDTTNSLAEYDISSTTFSTSGSTRIATGYAALGASYLQIPYEIPLVFSGLNSVQDTITIIGRGTTGTANFGATIQWSERY